MRRYMYNAHLNVHKWFLSENNSKIGNIIPNFCQDSFGLTHWDYLRKPFKEWSLRFEVVILLVW